MLVRKDAKQYIYMEDEPVGQIRITVSGDTAEISYSICVEKRCMGYAKEMVGLLQVQVQKDFPGVKKLIAKVKPDNIASQKVFLDTGYTYKCNVYEIETDACGAISKTLETNSGGVLFLTNNSNSLDLYHWLKQRETVHIYSERLLMCQLQNLKPDFIISYNYKYLISRELIEYMNGRIWNLHISFLPWNRGSNPNIWSFIDDTPKGVTIHQVNEGLDTGKILYQKQCFFDIEKETLQTTYDKLNKEIVELMKEKWDEMKDGCYSLTEQAGKGSCHVKKELDMLKEKIKFSWNDNIGDFLRRYKNIEMGYKEQYYRMEIFS